MSQDQRIDFTIAARNQMQQVLDSIESQADRIASKLGSLRVGNGGPMGGFGGPSSPATASVRSVGAPGYTGRSDPVTPAMRAARIGVYWQQFESGETERSYRSWINAKDPSGNWNRDNFGPGPTSFTDAYYGDTFAGRREGVMQSQAWEDNRRFDERREVARQREVRRQDDALRQMDQDMGWYYNSPRSPGYMPTPLSRWEQWDDFARGPGGRFLRGGLLAAGTSAQAWVQQQTQTTLTGRPDLMAQAGIGWGLAGGLVGAGVGSLFPGYGSFIGASVGSQVGATFGQYLTADTVADISRRQNAMGTAAMMALLAGDYGGAAEPVLRQGHWWGGAPVPDGVRNTNPILAGTSRLSALARSRSDLITRQFWNNDQQFGPTPQEMTSVYNSAYTGLLEGGDDPDALTGGMTDVYDEVWSGRYVQGRQIGTRRARRLKGTTRQQTQVSALDSILMPGIKGVPPIYSQGVGLDDLSPLPRRQMRFGGYDPIVDGANWVADRFLPHSAGGQLLRPGRPGIPARTGTRNSTTTTTTTGEEYEYYDQPVYDQVPEMVKRYRQEAERSYQRIGDQAAAKYGKDAAESIMTRVFAPIQSANLQTNGNFVDILARFGLSSTLTYSNLLTPFGSAPAYDPTVLRQLHTEMARTERGLGFAATLDRGVGRATRSLLDGEMGVIGDAPGGKDSLLYSQLRAQRRSARLQEYAEEDITAFDIPGTVLAGKRAQANFLPFNPSSIYRLDLQQIRMNERQLGVLTRRKAALKASGDLSEAEELHLTQQITGLQTGIAQAKGELSEDLPNRLPVLAAGTPAFFSQVTSDQLAALRLGGRGLPYRGYGAVGGHQVKMQNDFMHSLGVSGIDPHSRSMDMNMGPAISALTTAIQNLTNTIQRSSQGGMGGGRGSWDRPDAILGHLSALLSRKTLDRPWERIPV